MVKNSQYDGKSRNNSRLHFVRLMTNCLIYFERVFLARGQNTREAQYPDFHFFKCHEGDEDSEEPDPLIGTPMSREFLTLSMVMTHGKLNAVCAVMDFNITMQLNLQTGWQAGASWCDSLEG